MLMSFQLDAPFEIDLDSGVLKFARIPLTLAPKQSVSALLVTDAGARAKSLRSNAGWQRYQLRHDLGDGRTLGATFVFFNSCLVEVRFGYGSKNDDWSNWSQARELARADDYQREIVRQLGKRGRFPWGVAEAGYNDKAACASLFVKYGSE